MIATSSTLDNAVKPSELLIAADLAIGSSTYALVTSTIEDGVQIINITDPYNPTAAWHITDEDGAFTTLNHPTSIITTTIGSSTYALVTARDDHGVQIIDITDPYEPIARSAAINNSDGFTALSNVEDVAITTIGSKTYALAISNVGDRESGVQIIDITAPSKDNSIIYGKSANQRITGFGIFCS